MDAGKNSRRSPSQPDTETTVAIIGIGLLDIAILASFITYWSTQCFPNASDGSFVTLGKATFRFIEFSAILFVICLVGTIIGSAVICTSVGRSFETIEQTGSGGLRPRTEGLPEVVWHGFVKIINLAVFVFGTILYLYLYDPVGTYKPGWLDRIGMQPFASITTLSLCSPGTAVPLGVTVIFFLPLRSSPTSPRPLLASSLSRPS